MALNNVLNTKAGLDIITQEEHDEITSTFEALADPEAASDSASVLANGAEPGSNSSIENVFYVNFNPNTEWLNDYWRQRLKSVTENVDLSSGFFSVRAAQTLDNVVAAGKISDKDEIQKANYLAKVINHQVTVAPWMNMLAVMAKEKTFTTKKEEFHKALISHFTEGLNLPNDILDKFEGFLSNVQNTIKKSPTSTSYYNNILIYIHVVVYVKDDLRQQWRPSIRTISFKPSQTLGTYVKDKDTKSSGSEVNIDFQYDQLDSVFKNDVFEKSAKPALMQSKELTTTIKAFNITVNSN